MVTAMSQKPTPSTVFPGLEDKSLASAPDLENKAADAAPAEEVTDEEVEPDPAPVEDVVGVTRVRMIHHGKHEGTTLLPGVTYPLPTRVADSLVGGSRATYAQ